VSRSRNILLFGSNDRAGLECCRSLGRAGHRVTILRLAPQRTPADHSRYCSESVFIGSPDSGVREYLAKLMDLLRSRRYDYLLPVDDLSCELVYSDYEAISAWVRVVGPGAASYLVSHNRFEALALAESVGLTQPATTLVKRGESPPVPSLPCRVRPVFSSAIIDDELQKFSEREVRTLDELDAKLRDDLPRVDVMLQAPVAGVDVGLNFCALDGNVLGAAVTVHLHRARRGTTDSYRKSEEVPPEALAIMQRIARRLSWTGFMSIECKGTKHNLITELVGYPWDSISLPIFAGVDFPNLLIEALEGRRSSSITLPTRTVFTRHLQTDIRWLAQSVKTEGLSVLAPWLGSLGRLLTGRERFDIERFGDPLPAIRQFDRYVRRLWAPKSPVATNLSAKSVQKTHSMLVVCQGNINRSVVAEHLLKARGFTSVRSAGLLGMSGRRPSRPAEAFLTDRLGIDASGFRSQSVTLALRGKEEIDVVLCFERKHLAEIVQRYPNLRGKVFLLSKLAGDSEGQPDIADPHGASEDAYLECFRRIERLVDKIAAAGTLADRTS
jgi:protein-tyrosine-phosphatase